MASKHCETAVIPSGWFRMGSDSHYAWERPCHRVWIDPFEMACTTVTREQYGVFLQATRVEPPTEWNNPAFDFADAPVVGVSWFDAVLYSQWLSATEGEKWRLPTEAEWEKACRGGFDNAAYAWGESSPSSIELFQGEWLTPRSVRTWKCNAFGLWNIGFNVHEWCLDWYSESYYSISPERNPAGPETGARRVSRGGSWRHQIKASRSAHRSSLPPAYRYSDYGFRLVRVSV
jgi:formylglycine-generating enzyme required for sulfatase activity